MKAEDREYPDDVIATVQPGWPHFPQVREVDVEQRNVRIPNYFQLNVIDRESETIHITLMYAVEEGDVGLRVVISSPFEVPAALDWLRDRQPMREWKRSAVFSIALDTAERGVSAELANTWLMADGDEQDSGQAYADRRDELLSPVKDAALSLPLDRRRNRVTDADLERAVAVYNEAREHGAPPTVAVQEALQLSRSGASRWIRMARDRGLLPPTSQGKR